MLDEFSSIGITWCESLASHSQRAHFEMITNPGCQRQLDPSLATVDIIPHLAVTRLTFEWPGMCVETVKLPTRYRVRHHFHSSVMHLLVAYEYGTRRAGDSYVEGVPRSTLRDLTGRLIFVPAGHEYREWHDPQTPIGATYLYFDPTRFQTDTGRCLADLVFEPRILFEEPTISGTVAKLGQVVAMPDQHNRLYIDALAIVLLNELVNVERRLPQANALTRGGLAIWQQRLVSDYIEQHLSEQIPLATLAHLARLSPFHFCRAFKRSFGLSPHRYHTNRRVERAKLLLAGRNHSVTEIGLTVGFSEASSFTAMFRKVTGKTPSSYHRALG